MSSSVSTASLSEGSKKLGLTPGPLHDEIPKPDREQDNSTTWEADYDKTYYETLFNGSGESMKGFYRQASGGQYDVTNTVEGWTQVDYNGAYYGANPREDEGGSWRPQAPPAPVPR